MQQPKRSKKSDKNTENLEYKQSRKSIKSDNVHVPLTSSTFRKIKASSSRPSTAKSRSSMKRGKQFRQPEEPVMRLPNSQRAEVPGNVAVHFASFYQNLEEAGATLDEERSSSLAKSSRNMPKMEFTRQMVHKLEHSAGTLDYGRQVSSLLDKTVESPGFHLKLPPPDNCAPSDKPCNDYYPLWYKDPNKLPQISRQEFRELKYKLNKTAQPKSSEKNYASGDSDFCYTDEDDEEAEEFEYEFQLSRKSSRSSRTESKVTSCRGRSEVPASRRSSSLDSSSSNEEKTDACETSDEIEDDEDWETGSDEKVEVQVVRNFAKIRNVRRGLAIAAKL